MVKHNPKFDYYALPGGAVEKDETLEAAMERELLEELNVRADVGKLLIVNDWIGSDPRVEFFFWIKNGADFRSANTKTATHGFELADITFGDPTDPKYDVKPSFLREKFARILEQGNDYPTEIARSYIETRKS